MMEQLVSIGAAIAVFIAAALRMNLLKLGRGCGPFQVLEALGLILLMGGCAGTVGEWFLPMADFRAETLVITGCALALVGISRGSPCDAVPRIRWDGIERRLARRARQTR